MNRVMTRLVVNPRRLSLLAVGLALGLAGSATADEKVDFTRDVRPILSKYCFKCHGPDEKAVKGDLRLDLREAAVDGGAVVPGKPHESELVRRIFAEDVFERMPPRSIKMELTEA